MRNLDARLTTIRMPGELRRALEDASRKEGYGITHFARSLLEEALATRGNDWARARLKEGREAMEWLAELKQRGPPGSGSPTLEGAKPP